MSHVLKLLTVTENNLSENIKEITRTYWVHQLDFRNGMGIRKALFTIHVITQRCRDVSVDVYAGFIDFRKAFDMIW